MPRSHFPVRGGAQSQPRYGAGNPSDATGGCAKCKEKSAEIDRLRQDLTRVRQGAPGGGGSPMIAGSSTMWIALCICGAGLLFALLALLHRG